MKYVLYIFVLSFFFLNCQPPVDHDKYQVAPITYDEWPENLISAYQAFMSDQSPETADQLFAAGEQMPVMNWELYLLID